MIFLSEIFMLFVMLKYSNLRQKYPFFSFWEFLENSWGILKCTNVFDSARRALSDSGPFLIKKLFLYFAKTGLLIFLIFSVFGVIFCFTLKSMSYYVMYYVMYYVILYMVFFTLFESAAVSGAPGFFLLLNNNKENFSSVSRFRWPHGRSQNLSGGHGI